VLNLIMGSLFYLWLHKRRHMPVWHNPQLPDRAAGASRGKGHSHAQPHPPWATNKPNQEQCLIYQALLFFGVDSVDSMVATVATVAATENPAKGTTHPHLRP